MCLKYIIERSQTRHGDNYENNPVWRVVRVLDDEHFQSVYQHITINSGLSYQNYQLNQKYKAQASGPIAIGANSFNTERYYPGFHAFVHFGDALNFANKLDKLNKRGYPLTTVTGDYAIVKIRGKEFICKGIDGTTGSITLVYNRIVMPETNDFPHVQFLNPKKWRR